MSLITDYLSRNLEKLNLCGSAEFAKACCVFHEERNPSMSIYKKSGSYTCFACGAKGGLAELIAHIEMLPMDTAIRKAIQLRKE